MFVCVCMCVYRCVGRGVVERVAKAARAVCAWKVCVCGCVGVWVCGWVG